jgi:hypothetical protein
MTDYSAFPRIEGLVDLACRKGVDVRPTLLRVLTDLYVQTRSHTPSEEAQYVELALRLIENVDDKTRAVVASRLAAYPRAPLAVTRRLAEFARQAPAPPLAPAAEPEAEDLGEAFFAATSYERQLILTNLQPAEPQAPPHPTAVETCRRLEAAVLDGRADEFIRILQSALMVPRPVAEKIAGDNGGEPLIIAAKALGMERAALERILLVLNPAIAHSVERVYELSALFDELGTHAAESMVALWRGQMPTRRAAHQPALWNDEQRSARAAATPSRYQSHRRSDAVAAQFRNSGR